VSGLELIIQGWLVILLFPVLHDLAEMQSFVNPSWVQWALASACTNWILFWWYF
jgi:hypothetical protein